MENKEYQKLIDIKIEKILNNIKATYNNSDYDDRSNSNEMNIFNLYEDEEYFLIKDLELISFCVEEKLIKELVKDFCKKDEINYISPDNDSRLLSSHLDGIITINNNNYGINYRRNRYNRISYNYTMDSETTRTVYNEYSLKNVYTIHFKSHVDTEGGPHHDGDISFKNFLTLIFPNLDVNEYFSKIKTTIMEAKRTTGLFAYPTFSKKYYDFFKEKVRNHFLNKTIDYFPSQYYVFPKSINKPKNSLKNTNQTIGILNDNIILNNFFNNKMYEVLIGDSDFAKSFLSSEYLYSQYKGREALDFTTIVSGYIKSVEILMKEIIEILDPNSQDYEPNNCSMGNLSTVIKNSNNIIIYNLSNPIRKIINDCFYAYNEDIRNQFMHKDIITEWSSSNDNIIDVNKIRNNTLFLYYLLLGATKLKNSNKKDLGYSFNPYQSLYKSLINPINKTFYYLFEFEDRDVKAIVPKYFMFTDFDDDGKVNNYCFDIYELKPEEKLSNRGEIKNIINQESRIIKISTFNMPIRVRDYYERNNIVWENQLQL